MSPLGIDEQLLDAARAGLLCRHRSMDDEASTRCKRPETLLQCAIRCAMGEQHSSKPVWVCERIDGGGRAEIHEHHSGWELRVYFQDRLELRRAFADVREAHERAMEALK